MKFPKKVIFPLLTLSLLGGTAAVTAILRYPEIDGISCPGVDANSVRLFIKRKRGFDPHFSMCYTSIL